MKPADLGVESWGSVALLLGGVAAIVVLAVLRSSRGGRSTPPTEPRSDAAEDPREGDHWEHYLCSMEDRPASILVDVGLADELDARTPTRLFELRLAYRDTHPNGMPKPSENALAEEVQREIERFCAEHDRYVGRVTTAGRRDFYVYSGRTQDEWAGLVEGIDGGSDRVSITAWDDPDHGTYREDLLPSEDDWQVIRDMDTCEALKSAGDDDTRARPFEHWLYFEEPGAARDFASWARDDERFTDVVERPATGKRPYGVRLKHEGTPQLGDLTRHTLALRRRAAELGGEYDGWECPVMKSSD